MAIVVAIVVDTVVLSGLSWCDSCSSSNLW